MPTLGARSALNYAMLVIPVAALGCALPGLGLSLRRLWRRQETALDVVVIAGATAIAATFTIHVGYSYGRYAATGWLMDAYPRYYLPLIAIVPLACLSLSRRDLQTPRWRIACWPFWSPGRHVPHFRRAVRLIRASFSGRGNDCGNHAAQSRNASRAGSLARAFNTLRVY